MTCSLTAWLRSALYRSPLTYLCTTEMDGEGYSTYKHLVCVGVYARGVSADLQSSMCSFGHSSLSPYCIDPIFLHKELVDDGS